MLTAQWSFTSPKRLALHPSSTVTRVPEPVPVKHMSTRQATDRSQTRFVRASPAMQNAASSQEVDEYLTLEDCVGGTPLVRLLRLPGQTSNIILAKLEGNNPAGSVKDRPAVSMITQAEAQGKLSPGDTLIEATSGNTGIALAMAAAIKGYKIKLIMPADQSEERKAAMAAFGAELISVPSSSDGGGMEAARDMASRMQAEGQGTVLDQFGNLANPMAHYQGTGPEIWQQTKGKVTHFVSSMGTTGTIMGTSRYLKEQKPDVRIIGLQPKEGSAIAGIRRWPKEYLPTIFQEERVDETMDISQREAEGTMRALARVEGIFAGPSSGGAVSAALRLSAKLTNATIVAIICDRGDRYLSTGVFSEQAAQHDPQPCGVQDYPSAVARLTTFPRPHYVLFTADRAKNTGQPWCPDCTRALPGIQHQVAQANGTLLEVEVGPRAIWKDAQHALRKDEEVRLTGIPTLVHWTPSGPGRRLGTKLEKASSPAEAEALVKQFVSATSKPEAHANGASR
ncbi:hypothetical protein WJX82_006524 [Trebouxia sp. C0006]